MDGGLLFFSLWYIHTAAEKYMPPGMHYVTIHYVKSIVFIMQHYRPFTRVQSFSMVL
jgi:hypothetical protein